MCVHAHVCVDVHSCTVCVLVCVCACMCVGTRTCVCVRVLAYMNACVSPHLQQATTITFTALQYMHCILNCL